MSQHQQYRVNENHVVYEVFNEEILAINLDQGIYFSLRGSGSQIWSMMLAGATPETISKAFSAAYAIDPSQVEPEIERFFAQLISHELIVPAATQQAYEPGTAPLAQDGQTFQPPLLESFTDMQDLLLLDPVHEADDAGWPVKRDDSATKA